MVRATVRVARATVRVARATVRVARATVRRGPQNVQEGFTHGKEPRNVADGVNKVTSVSGWRFADGRSPLAVLAVTLLGACDSGMAPTTPSAPGFMSAPGPAPVAGTVTDADGTFGLHGGFVIEEGRGLTYNFQSVGRPGIEDIDSLNWTISLTPERTRDLLGGALFTVPDEETVSLAGYPVGQGSVVRPVRTVLFTLSRDQLRAELVAELGPVFMTRGPVPASFSPTATVRLWGVFPVACSVRGRVVGEEAGGRPVYEYLQDPTFRTAFCRNAIDAYGLRPLLRMNNLS